MDASKERKTNVRMRILAAGALCAMLIAAWLLAVPACERTEEGTIPASLPATAAPVSSPSAGGPALQPAEQPQAVEIVVKPRPDGKGDCYYLGDEAVTGPGELLKRLKSFGNRGTPVVIKAHPLAKWSSVVEAFNAAVKAEFETIAFAAMTEQGAGPASAPESLPAASEPAR